MERQTRRVPPPKDDTGRSTLIHAIAALLVEDVSALCVRMATINRGNLDPGPKHSINGAKRER